MLQKELKNIADGSAAKIIASKNNGLFAKEPFNHFAIDSFFDANLADKALDSFPDLDSEEWERTNTPEIEVKMRSKWTSEFDIPENIIDIIRVMNSASILKALSEVFEIPKLIPDPYFSGGGLNATVSGGLLDVHVDGNYHDATGLNRRLNMILYLNPGWESHWGGDFGLYDETGKNIVKKIAPLHNRVIAFDTNDFSFHGSPEPLNFPARNARRSIILYYYTKANRPSHQISVEQPHSALWRKKGWTDKRGDKTRDFE